MNEEIKPDIIDTLAYFDIFSYPLRLEQIHLYLHFGNVSKKDLKELIREIPIIEEKKGLYFFKGRDNIVLTRKVRERVSREKIKLGIHYSNIIGKIPGVKMVGLTGSISMLNSLEEDDIDLFIVTRKNTLWVTRIMVVIAAKLMGIKREYKSKATTNKLCLNMFMDERELEISDKNIYTAHEIVQMRVYHDDNTLKKFIQSNLWIRHFFPNLYLKTENKGKKKKTERAYIERGLEVLNLTAFFVQYLYMMRKIKNEKVSLTKAFFHPGKTSEFILKEHEKRSVFYNEMNLKLLNPDFFERKSLLLQKTKAEN